MNSILKFWNYTIEANKNRCNVVRFLPKLQSEYLKMITSENLTPPPPPNPLDISFKHKKPHIFKFRILVFK